VNKTNEFIQENEINPNTKDSSNQCTTNSTKSSSSINNNTITIGEQKSPTNEKNQSDNNLNQFKELQLLEEDFEFNFTEIKSVKNILLNLQTLVKIRFFKKKIKKENK
jgi:hypothetical protein